MGGAPPIFLRAKPWGRGCLDFTKIQSGIRETLTGYTGLDCYPVSGIHSNLFPSLCFLLTSLCPVPYRALKQQLLGTTYVNRKLFFFAPLSRDFEQIFGQIVSIRVKTLSNTNMVTSRPIKREKRSLPVDMRRSKTSLEYLNAWLDGGLGKKTIF